MPHEYGHTGNGNGSSSSRVGRNTTNAQGRVAPPGYHFMPDGSLMSDVEHARLYGSVTSELLTGLKIDYSDIPQDGGTKTFIVQGTSNAVFSLEVKASNGYYYNFTTNQFQVAKYRLDKIQINGGAYQGIITFPEVSSDDQYDIYFWAETNTKHSKYYQVRFEDGSVDLNRSKGSNSLLIQKVLYQYIDHDLTLSPYSAGGTISGSVTSDTISVSASTSKTFIPFEMKVTATSANVYTITTQPTAKDFIAFTTPTVSSPVQLPGENIYPTARAAFTGDDVNGAVTSGSVVRMDNTDLSAVIAVGDKITATTATDTVDGAVSSSNRIVMDSNVAAKMAVGDQVTGAGIADTAIVTVTHLNPDSDNAKELQVSEAVSISDGVTLTFSSKVNRDLTTVTVVETEGTATDFTMSQAIQFRDNQPLVFTPQKNYQWQMSTVHDLKPGMIAAPDGTSEENTVISEYKDIVKLYENTDEEISIVKFKEKAVKSSKKPTITKGRVTDQDGTIVFNKQQKLALTDVTMKIGGYGQDMIFFVSGYKVKFRNLKIELNEITTTTTSSTIGSSSTSVAVAARTGILNDISIVSGIGIDGSSGLPFVDSGAGATSAGTLVLSAAQELESGITLTFTGSGNIATITGEIQILSAPPSDFTLRFDIDRVLKLN